MSPAVSCFVAKFLGRIYLVGILPLLPALTSGISAPLIKDFYENEELIAITKELADTLRRNKTIDWQKRESARAKMRMLIKKLLKKHKYPPEGMEDAVQTVMTQCELWTDNNKDQRNHMDKYVDSHKKKIEVLDEVLESKFQINNKEKIEELMNIYQEYIDKETSKEKKRNSIILTIFSAFAGVLTISFENMGVIGIDFTNWLYVATFLLVFVAAAGIWIYSYTFFDTLKRKYELMIKDLKDLLLLKY